MGITRKEVMESPSVHNLTKDVLRLTEGKDIVDRVNDVELALIVLRNELEEELFGEMTPAERDGEVEDKEEHK
jgi:hypothetical protein